jgi:hypothetical protein
MKYLTSCKMLLFLLLGTSTLASAQVIFSDSFNRTGNLAGSTPTVDPSGTVWQVGTNGAGNTITTTAGAATTTNLSNGTSVNGVLNIPTAYLDNTGSLIAGTYTLSLTMSTSGNPSTSGVEFGFGHFANVTLDPWNVPAGNDNLGFANIDLLLPEGSADINGGPHLTDGNSSGANSNAVGITVTAPQTFVLTLTSAGANAPWTLSATLNGTAFTFNGLSTLTYDTNGDPLASDLPGDFNGNPQPHTDQVFLNEYSSGTGTFSDLSLTYSAVPEPSTYALLGLSVLLLVGFRLRKFAI